MAMCSAGERCPRSGGGMPVSPLPFRLVTGVVSGVFSGSTGYSIKEPSYTRRVAATHCCAAAP